MFRQRDNIYVILKIQDDMSTEDMHVYLNGIMFNICRVFVCVPSWIWGTGHIHCNWPSWLLLMLGQTIQAEQLNWLHFGFIHGNAMPQGRQDMLSSQIPLVMLSALCADKCFVTIEIHFDTDHGISTTVLGNRCIYVQALVQTSKRSLLGCAQLADTLRPRAELHLQLFQVPAFMCASFCFSPTLAQAHYTLFNHFQWVQGISTLLVSSSTCVLSSLPPCNKSQQNSCWQVVKSVRAFLLAVPDLYFYIGFHFLWTKFYH